MLIKLTDIVSDGLHGLILCTFFFITEAEIDASVLKWDRGKGHICPCCPEETRQRGEHRQCLKKHLPGKLGPEEKVPPRNITARRITGHFSGKNLFQFESSGNGLIRRWIKSTVSAAGKDRSKSMSGAVSQGHTCKKATQHSPK